MIYFSFHRISVYELYCICLSSKQLTVYLPLPPHLRRLWSASGQTSSADLRDG